jgi:hypothetical protein
VLINVAAIGGFGNPVSSTSGCAEANRAVVAVSAGLMGGFKEERMVGSIDLWLALGVLLSTAATDAVYVMFNAAVSARKRVPAATWSSVWYLLSAFAVISYTKNWVYVVFAAVGSWVGAYVSMTLLRSSSDRMLRQ